MRIYVTNLGRHDYSSLEKMGEVVFLTKGLVDRFKVSSLLIQIEDGLATSEPTDYIVVGSLSILCILASIAFVRKHDCLNLLLFSNGSYVKREIRWDA